MGKSIDPIRLVPEMRDAELLNSTLRPIVSMSFQLAIPWLVALPQSPPPLHQPGAIMHERTAAGHQKSANAQLYLNYLSHPRGQAHFVSWLHLLRLLHRHNSSYGALTFTPVGLPPTEHASLHWTHLPPAIWLSPF